MRIKIAHFIWIIFFILTSPCFGRDLSLGLSPEEISWLDKNITVRVRIGNAPPFMLTDGEIRGMAIDYLTRIFNKNGIKFQYIPPSQVSWPQALDYIAQHKGVDMAPTAKITDERKRHMLFTDEYIFAPWVIFTRSDTDFISSIADLKGKTVSVEQGYVIHNILKQDYPEIHLKVAPAGVANSSEIPIKDLSTGLVDAYIGNLLSTTYAIQKKGYTNIKVAAPTPFDNHNQAMAIRSDWPELTRIINKTLAAMTPEEHAAIRNRWLSIRYEYGINKIDILKWVSGVIGVASLFIGVVLFWNQRLKTEVSFRKKVEIALKKNVQRYISAQRLGQVGNWEYELTTEKFWGSDQARHIYGFDPTDENFTTDQVENCIPDRARVHQALVDLVEKNIPYDLEFEMHPMSGPSRKFIKSLAEVVRDEAGVPTKVIGVVQDITQRRHTEEKIKNALNEKEILLKEIHHRVKNNMQLIQSLLSLQAQTLTETAHKTPLIESINRVKSMALIHEILYRSDNVGHLDTADYFNRIVHHLFKIYHRPDLDVDLKIEVDPVEMNLDHCVSCGLILNELISNVFKHSFNSASQGIISIFFKEKNPGQVMLTVMDDGCGLPPDFNMDEAQTLGLKIVSLLVTGQLNGSLRVSPPPGTRFDIQFPLGQKA